MNGSEGPKHKISVVVGGKEITGWQSYRIDTSLIDPADSFTLTMPFDIDAFRLCSTDTRVKVTIDRVTILDGFIDERMKAHRAGLLTITGRDKVGRLVQESAPSVNYDRLKISQLVTYLAHPWFARVVLSNARNRRVVRGKGRKVRDSGRVFVDSKVGTRIDPGQMRWAVIEELCEQAGYLVWSSADGAELVIGQPDFDQELQYAFVAAEPGSSISSTVEDMTIIDSTADRYSRIIVLGSGAGTESSYGRPVAARSGDARDNPDTVDGEGRSFTEPKRLIIANERDVTGKVDCDVEARRQMDRRDMRGHVVRVECEGHGQSLDGDEVSLFAIDCMGNVEDHETGLRGAYLITSCSYSSDRDGAESTSIELLRKGTRLTP